MEATLKFPVGLSLIAVTNGVPNVKFGMETGHKHIVYEILFVSEWV
jgi:hypothetical protein